MSVWCGALSDKSDKSDKSDFMGAPQVQKKEGAAKHRVLQHPFFVFISSCFFKGKIEKVDGVVAADLFPHFIGEFP